jgi:hypothetical protein
MNRSWKKNICRLTQCLLVFVLVDSLALADEPTYGSVNGWGSLVDPDRDCSFTISNDYVGIKIPATPHDLSAELKRMNAPRVVQPMEGDFEIEVEVWGIQQPELPTINTRTAYCGNGLVLMQDDQNYIRLERAALRRGDTTRYYINFEQRIDGHNVRFGAPDDFAMEFDDGIYLKLIVQGTTVTGFVKIPNEEWHEMGKKKIDDKKPLAVGIAAVNATNSPLTASFRELRLTQLESAAE